MRKLTFQIYIFSVELNYINYLFLNPHKQLFHTKVKSFNLHFAKFCNITIRTLHL